MRGNTLYYNGAFDTLNSPWRGPNKAVGISAKHVGFMTIENNIIVCRSKEYSAFAVWDNSVTTVTNNFLQDCSVSLRTPAVNTVEGDPMFRSPNVDLRMADFRLSENSLASGYGAETLVQCNNSIK